MGNRIATVLIYLSTVDGGATVFPHIGVRVEPRAGQAVFWHNLDESGQPIPRTLHAACPVISGSKWVANKWIHENGQRTQCPRKQSFN